MVQKSRETICLLIQLLILVTYTSGIFYHWIYTSFLSQRDVRWAWIKLLSHLTLWLTISKFSINFIQRLNFEIAKDPITRQNSVNLTDSTYTAGLFLAQRLNIIQKMYPTEPIPGNPCQEHESEPAYNIGYKDIELLVWITNTYLIWQNKYRTLTQICTSTIVGITQSITVDLLLNYKYKQTTGIPESIK